MKKELISGKGQGSPERQQLNGKRTQEVMGCKGRPAGLLL